MNYASKLRALAALVAMTLSCASVKPAVQVPQPQIPTPHVVEGKTWSISLPESWTVRRDTKRDDRASQELFAKSQGTPAVTVVINVVFLDQADDPSDEDFGPVVLMAIVKSGGKILAAKRTDVDANPGVAAVVVFPNGIVTLQKAFGRSGLGYMLHCAGSVDQGNEVMTECSEVLSTFRVKQ